MKFTYALVISALMAALPLLAVYAPVPEQEQGRDLTVAVKAGLSYDSNIFGASSDAISSNIWELAPRVTYNHSVTDQTFFSGSYGLVLDEIERRPGKKLLDSHDLTLRLAHAFTKSTTLDVTNVFISARNPESLLNGVPLNTDQSFTREQLDGRLVTSVSPKIGLELKARGADMRYRQAALGRLLDRVENLYGVAGNYAVLPEVKAVAEYRHLDVYYWTRGEDKNKHSDYFMGGVDYDIARKLTLSSRLGAEWRRRESAANATAPFIELSARYQYAEQSFLTGGYAHTFDEASDPERFTDQKVDRFFVNVQHAVTARIVASVGVDYEPAVLQGRRDIPPFGLSVADLDETTARTGAAISYLPTKNWVITASYDLDRVRSDEASRSVERHRVGLSAAYTF